MSGCYGSSREDRYFERQLDNYLDSLDNPCGEHEFTAKLRGGTVKVYADVQAERDEDGTQLYAEITRCHWTFHEEADVDLDSDEEDELRGIALEIANDY